MLTQPKSTKYKKFFKKRKLPRPSNAIRRLSPQSSFSIVALESAFLNYKQLEATRQGIRRTLKKQGRVEILIRPEIGISTLSSGVRMGKGKGKVKKWVVALSSGRTLVRVIGVEEDEAIPALECGASKLPLKVRIYPF
uniref:Ribosomal protein L16 n=1 Tax=Ishige okamurae TaxID=233772 RepID=A0A4Y5T8V6_9PHAE|nr:ribosomal protein L16 [Ishige okamurae]QDB64161.1 ribosomal protein L16 [Ishige okamurae]WBP70199.1 ribosomal protein L16 [Ishige okamurae]